MSEATASLAMARAKRKADREARGKKQAEAAELDRVATEKQAREADIASAVAQAVAKSMAVSESSAPSAQHKSIASSIKDQKEIQKLQKKLNVMMDDLNHVVKDLNTVNQSVATKAMLNAQTVNMEQHVASLRKHMMAELKATTADYVKVSALEQFQHKVDFTQLVARMDKLIRSKVKDVFVYEGEPIFKRLWDKREKEMMHNMKKSARHGRGASSGSFNNMPSMDAAAPASLPSTNIAHESMDEVEDRALDAMQGSAASDMVGLWKLADNLKVDAKLERLIKAWLGFQAELLQKQARQTALFHEKITEARNGGGGGHSQTSGAHMPTAGGGGRTRQQIIEDRQEKEAKEAHRQMNEDDMKIQKEMIQKVALLEEKLVQSNRDMDSIKNSFKHQLEAVQQKGIAMEEKVELFLSQGAEFRAAVQQEVAGIRGDVDGLIDDLDDMRGDFEKAKREKEERTAAKKRNYRSERDIILSEAKRKMETVEKARLDLLDVGHTIKFERDEMQKKWNKHSEKMEYTIKNATKVLQDRSHADVSESMVKIEHKIWDKLHDIQNSLREDVRSKVNAVKERLNKEEHAMNDMTKSIGALARLTEEMKDVHKTTEFHGVELKQMRSSTAKLEKTTAQMLDKGGEVTERIKIVEKLQTKLAEQQRAQGLHLQDANDVSKKQSVNMKALQQEVNMLKSTKSNQKAFEDLESDVTLLRGDVTSLKCESRQEVEALGKNLTKAMANREAVVTKITNLLGKKIADTEHLLQGSITKIAQHSNVNARVAEKAVDFVGRLTKKRRTRSMLLATTSESKRDEHVEPPRSKKNTGTTVSERILGNTTYVMDQSKEEGRPPPVIQKHSPTVQFSKQKLNPPSATPKAPEVDGLVPIPEGDAESALEKLQEGVDIERMWRTPAGGKHADESTAKDDAHGDGVESNAEIEVPFFTHWPVLLEQCYPAALEWRRRVEPLPPRHRRIDMDEEALARAQMERKGPVQKGLRRWWVELALENETVSHVEEQGSLLKKDVYTYLHGQLLKIFVPETTEAQAHAAAEDDWGTDAAGANSIDKQRFCSMVYELAWNFCGVGSVDDYKCFLHAICSQVSGIETKEDFNNMKQRKSLAARYDEDLLRNDRRERRDRDKRKIEREYSSGAVLNMPPKSPTKTALYHAPAATSSISKRVTKYNDDDSPKTMAAERGAMTCVPVPEEDEFNQNIYAILNEYRDQPFASPSSLDSRAGSIAVPVKLLEDIIWQQQALVNEVNTLSRYKEHPKESTNVQKQISTMEQSLDTMKMQLTQGMGQISARLERERKLWETEQQNLLRDMKLANDSLLNELHRLQAKSRKQQTQPKAQSPPKKRAGGSLPAMMERQFGGSFSTPALPIATRSSLEEARSPTQLNRW